MKNSVTINAMMDPGAKWSVKVAKSASLLLRMVAALIIKMFGGSPIPVAVPPMFEKICSFIIIIIIIIIRKNK